MMATNAAAKMSCPFMPRYTLLAMYANTMIAPRFCPLLLSESPDDTIFLPCWYGVVFVSRPWQGYVLVHRTTRPCMLRSLREGVAVRCMPYAPPLPKMPLWWCLAFRVPPTATPHTSLRVLHALWVAVWPLVFCCCWRCRLFSISVHCFPHVVSYNSPIGAHVLHVRAEQIPGEPHAPTDVC